MDREASSHAPGTPALRGACILALRLAAMPATLHPRAVDAGMMPKEYAQWLSHESADPLEDLATRIREAGLSVYGFGEQKTPKPFVAACDKFIFTESLRKPALGSPQKRRCKHRSNLS